jgi:hypothetical protein
MTTLERAIVSRWLRVGLPLAAVAVVFEALFELQRVAGKEEWPAAVEWWRLLGSVCLGAAVGTAIALAFAAAHVFWRLRRDHVFESLVSAGFGPARLRRCTLQMAAITALALAGLGTAATVLRTRPDPALTPDRTWWLWRPEAPAAALRFDAESLAVAPLPASAGVDLDPVALLHLLAAAVLGGALVLLACWTAIFATRSQPLAVHSTVLHLGLLLAILGLFGPWPSIVPALVAVVAADLVFARRGLRQVA